MQPVPCRLQPCDGYRLRSFSFYRDVEYLAPHRRIAHPAKRELIPILIFRFRNSDALSFAGGCDPRINDHLVNGVPRLGDDKLQVQVRHILDNNGLGPRAVRVHRVGARAGRQRGS
jgi:hypothetical protein